jgi:hypothetical protein
MGMTCYGVVSRYPRHLISRFFRCDVHDGNIGQAQLVLCMPGGQWSSGLFILVSIVDIGVACCHALKRSDLGQWVRSGKYIANLSNLYALHDRPTKSDFNDFEYLSNCSDNIFRVNLSRSHHNQPFPQELPLDQAELLAQIFPPRRQLDAASSMR